MMASITSPLHRRAQCIFHHARLGVLHGAGSLSSCEASGAFLGDSQSRAATHERCSTRTLCEGCMQAGIPCEVLRARAHSAQHRGTICFQMVHVASSGFGRQRNQPAAQPQAWLLLARSLLRCDVPAAAVRTDPGDTTPEL